MLAEGDRLGAGGFGVVFKAKHKLLNMDFAVKVFDPSFDDGNRPDMDRFFREARVLFGLNHPNIIRIYDAGLLGKKPYIKMEYFPGRTLSEFLKAHGNLSARKARVLVSKLAEGMAHAHERNVIHRDLKPSNIMLATKEDVRIVDFGLGLFIEADLVSRITKTGERAVGGYYCAPELVADPHLLSLACDVYSLGALWFTALTGLPPAGADLVAAIHSIEIPSADRDILLRSMASKERRYQSAMQLLDALCGS